MPEVHSNEVKMLSVKQLTFDSQNPRFPSEIASGPTDLLLEKFIKDERLLEIVDSIGNHDFFHGEPLLVVPLKKSGKANSVSYKVVEGNRRLAALKLLSGELKSPSGRLSIIDAVESAEFRPDKVPCIVFDNEDKVMRYLGFKHITGVKAWGALQKARYAKRLWAHYQHLPIEEGLKKLAKEIGSRSDYVGQILCSLNLYEIAEKDNFFGLDVSSNQIEFSVLTTALSYKNITDFMELDSKSDIKAADLNKAHLKDVVDWLFVSPDQRKPVVPDSRDLKKLAAVVSSEDALRDLRINRQLAEAYELSKGPEVALMEAMRIIGRRLDSCQQLAMKTPNKSAELLDMAESLASKAGYLEAIMRKPKRSRK